MPEVFISYRQLDTIAERVYEYLERELYPGAVFFDRRTLGPDDFEKEIDREFRSVRVLVLIIGPEFVRRIGELDGPTDYVGMELRLARARGITVVPLSLTAERFEDLAWPAEFAWVRKQTGLSLSNPLPSELDARLGPLLRLVTARLTLYWERRLEAESAARTSARRAGRVAIVAALVFLAGLVWGWWMYWAVPPCPPPDPPPTRVPLNVALTPNVYHASEYLRRKPVGLPEGAAADREHHFMDKWLEQFYRGVELLSCPPPPNGGEWPVRERVYIATFDFKKHYSTFTINLKIQQGFRISHGYAYLKSNSDPTGQSYRPVYRQLKLEYDITRVQRDHRPVQVVEPNPGEALFLVLVVFRTDQQLAWPENGQNLGLVLEKS